MLRIIPASEPIQVERIITTVYSPPGLGKTSLGFSADAPLLFDADGGAYRSAFRKDSVPAQSWDDFAGIAADDVKPYKTLVMDTAGRTLDLLAADIIQKNPKLGRGGALTLQGFGELKSRFIAYLKLMRSFGLDIVLIAHSDEKQQGDELIERIDMQGASKNEVYKCSDAMAKLAIRDGRRVLAFSPTETAFGKDPAHLGTIIVPDLHDDPHFLGGVIRQIKEKLNELSEEQRTARAKAKERAEEWSAEIAGATTAGKLTKLVAKAQSKNEKRELLEAARAAGFEWSAGDEKFAAVKEEEQETAGAPA